MDLRPIFSPDSVSDDLEFHDMVNEDTAMDSTDSADTAPDEPAGSSIHENMTCPSILEPALPPLYPGRNDESP